MCKACSALFRYILKEVRVCFSSSVCTKNNCSSSICTKNCSSSICTKNNCSSSIYTKNNCSSSICTKNNRSSSIYTKNNCSSSICTKNNRSSFTLRNTVHPLSTLRKTEFGFSNQTSAIFCSILRGRGFGSL